jgi:16S rRNA (cytidine1402-2'-O)-methyltransferase
MSTDDTFPQALEEIDFFSDNNFHSTGKRQKISAGLYLVATPIGNLRDISLRALDVLSQVDKVVCEDTRVTGKLLSLLGLKKELMIYNDHSQDFTRDQILKLLADGQKIALVSDAGMPLISDPGYKLVQKIIEANIPVTSIAGANAPLMALQLSSLPPNQFCFLGFVSSRSKARLDELRAWAQVEASLILFENALRLKDLLIDALEVFGNRRASFSREITKLHEQTMRGTLQDLIAMLNDTQPPKGEIVVVIEGATKTESDYSQSDIEEMLANALKTHSLKDSVALIVDATHKPKKEIYELALRLQQD